MQTKVTENLEMIVIDTTPRYEKMPSQHKLHNYWRYCWGPISQDVMGKVATINIQRKEGITERKRWKCNNIIS